MLFAALFGLINVHSWASFHFYRSRSQFLTHISSRGAYCKRNDDPEAVSVEGVRYMYYMDNQLAKREKRIRYPTILTFLSCK